MIRVGGQSGTAIFSTMSLAWTGAWCRVRCRRTGEDAEGRSKRATHSLNPLIRTAGARHPCGGHSSRCLRLSNRRAGVDREQMAVLGRQLDLEIVALPVAAPPAPRAAPCEHGTPATSRSSTRDVAQGLGEMDSRREPRPPRVALGRTDIVRPETRTGVACRTGTRQAPDAQGPLRPRRTAGGLAPPSLRGGLDQVHLRRADLRGDEAVDRLVEQLVGRADLDDPALADARRSAAPCSGPRARRAWRRAWSCRARDAAA